MLRFTQYYLVSMILPGLINGLLLYWTLTLWEFKIVAIEGLPTELQWFLFLTIAVVVNLLIGMRTEGWIHSLVTVGWREDERKQSCDDLRNWRDRLISGPGQSQDTMVPHIVSWTEKLMSEYYFLNNICPGLVLTTVISIKCLCDADDSRPLAISFVLLSLLSYYLFPFVMGVWLRELRTMLSKHS